MADDPRPGWPDEFGLVGQPDTPTEFIEPANMLATAARPRLLELGFEETQIVEWAACYVVATGDEASELEPFLAWIAARQRSS